MYVLNPATHKLDLIQNGQVVAAGIDSASGPMSVLTAW